MRIATWNINSIRIRLNNIAKFDALYHPDVICFQETKVTDQDFPKKALSDLGYNYIITKGMKSYNGVAIVSRLPLSNVNYRDWVGRSDCRHITADLPENITLHNFYVPAGGDIPDPQKNEKFAHKLDFLEEMKVWMSENHRKNQKIILVGDLNIAPLENDVWSHQQLKNIVSHTTIEIEKLNSVQQSLNWLDTARYFIPSEKKLYSWWSYRAKDWQISNRGRRLDHIWVTPPLKPYLQNVTIDSAARGWEKPSDHVAVILDMNLN